MKIQIFQHFCIANAFLRAETFAEKNNFVLDYIKKSRFLDF